MTRAERETAYVDYVTARRPHLRRVAYALCGDWHQADDLLQTALVKLYVAWPRVRRSGSEDAYVRRILVRASIDESRRPWRRERTTEVLPDRPAAEPTGVEERSELFDALQDLPAQQRAAVVLRHWLGLSVAETAAELGINEGTVKSHTSRGLAALRLTLEPSEMG
ncbi:SigE family RNA polymerase sigma factor [Nocardioides immobilis]|uniref:SigE family RNA polymerase sigma factor n=2 Tax=Nocardioides immobilis TaxID=2049295 RepID=A0A417Y4H1_9ACTN|nr:SigE family RNA polymerase sigma factor [Nocardioides immobilis]